MGDDRQSAANKTTFLELVKADLDSTRFIPELLTASFGAIALFAGYVILHAAMGMPLLIPDLSITFAIIATAGLIGFILLWIIRLLSIRNLYIHGEEITGKVTLSQTTLLNLIRLQYTYSLNGEDYKNENVLWKSSKIRTLQSGDDIKFIVDRTNPNYAIILDSELKIN